MQIFTDTNFDFIGKRAIALGSSVVVLVVSIGAIVTVGFNFGIDFRGGSQVEFKFAETPDVAELRSRLAALPEETSIQRVGSPEEHTVLVRARNPEGEEGQSDVSERIMAALYDPEEAAAAASGRTNLNQAGGEELAALLRDCPGSPADVDGVVGGLTELRRAQQGVIPSYDALEGVAGMTPELRSCLEGASFLPRFAKWKDDFVGPKVGKELRTKAVWAIGFALVGILAYIWYRFQIQYGIGAVLALFHDVVITTGLLVLLREEFTLTVVAALLTLAGYSVNDTIVVFDRIRENLRVMRTSDLTAVVNRSINQTLSRTVLTALTTLLVVLTMFFLGGAEFHGFALALLIGITLGTYSSVFVASPLLVYWHDYFVQTRARRVARA